MVSETIFLVGICIFSGSLYLMCLLHAFTGVKYGILGAITPIGGVCLILGWMSLTLCEALLDVSLACLLGFVDWLWGYPHRTRPVWSVPTRMEMAIPNARNATTQTQTHILVP